MEMWWFIIPWPTRQSNPALLLRVSTTVVGKESKQKLNYCHIATHWGHVECYTTLVISTLLATSVSPQVGVSDNPCRYYQWWVPPYFLQPVTSREHAVTWGRWYMWLHVCTILRSILELHVQTAMVSTVVIAMLCSLHLSSTLCTCTNSLFKWMWLLRKHENISWNISSSYTASLNVFFYMNFNFNVTLL